MQIAGDNRTERHLPTLNQLGGDLLRVTTLQLLTTLALPFVAMGCYALFASWRWWPLAVASVMMLSFITVYIPHDARAREPLTQTRLFRGRLIQLIAFDHLYHLEHHLYPAVPHHHWKALAERLDSYFEHAGIKPYVRPSK